MKLRDLHAKALARAQSEEEVSSSPRPAVSEPEPQAKIRPFLPRPLGREDAAGVWEVWEPLFDWLRAHAPDRLQSIFEAEEALLALEQAGIPQGEQYDQACAELLWRFEEARRLRMGTAVKVWIQ